MESNYTLVKTENDEMLKNASQGKVPLSIMRTLYECMRDWSDNQQDAYIKAIDTNDWTEYDDLYIQKL